MMVIRWICGRIKLNRVRNEVIRAKLGVTLIVYKMREHRLRWFVHVTMMSADAPVRRCGEINPF